MGRTVYWMNTSLDLRIEHTVGENGRADWARIDRTLHEEFNARARGLAMMWEGRVMYEIMEEFWPAAADDESLDDYLRDFGRIWTTMPKVLVSDSRTEAGHNTRVVGGEGALDQLADIRAETDGDVGVGGATLATQLLRAGLLDELLLFVHPAILGEGRPLFDALDAPVQCELLEQSSFPNGVTLHRYALGTV
ncbi:dihydrofolate reductase family protein [Euzebya rosea]|uniref:dihydrofolate reductase family protein n=1 Tax=Euzebya rosea TaxID=2052804 RepID=UPI000D3EA75A|nr:dihydrofolate reductase family protein [Euzebya rosea]